jgi:hypothetical protein
MTVTREQILADLDAFTAARDAAADAHTATSAAHANVLSVTTVEQGQIDAAVAHFDIATTQAKSEATDAEAAEAGANVTEDSAFDTLVADITAFKNEE